MRLEETPRKGTLWSYNQRVYKLVVVSITLDEVLLADVSDHKPYKTSYTLFQNYKRVFRVTQVARILSRSPRAIYKYEAQGHIDPPLRVQIGKYAHRFYNKEDILAIYKAISQINMGRPRKDSRIINNTLPNTNKFIQELEKWFK